MKKFLTAIFSTTIVLTSLLSFPVQAATGKIINNKTYVPVRGVFEELGFFVEYSTELESAIIRDDNYLIIIPKNKSYFTVNDNVITPDSSQTIIDGSMYLPLRAIGESIGSTLDWDGDAKVAHITYNGKDSYVNCSENGEINKINKEKTPTEICYENKEMFIKFAEDAIKNGDTGESSVSERLKFPHTADFSNDDAVVTYVPNDESYETVRVNGYVSSQNGLGLMVEETYNVAIKYDISNGKPVNLRLYLVIF